MSGYLLDMRPRGAGGGSSGAPVDATYITQTPNATLTNEQALSLLATGLLKSTTGTGVLSIAVPTVDYASAAQGALADTALQPTDIGVTVQAWDTDLDTLGALTKTKGNLIAGDGANWQALPVGANGFVLVADSVEATGLKWAAIAAGVSSVFGRTGAVVAVAGDYTAALVTNAPAGGVAAVTVQAAIDELDAEKQPLDATLTALAAYSTNGLITQTAADTFTGRSIAVGAGAYLSVSNGDGVAGNPILDLADAELLALAGLTSAADKLPYFTGPGTAALADFTAFARTILDDANQGAVQTTLGLVIGTNVQAWDADLDTLAGLAKTDGNFIVGDGAAWVVESGATVRTSLGLGTLAVINDAPSDGSTYGRNNAAWAVVSTGSTLPVADTQTIVKGSVDATKLLRFEVDGFTAGATRVLTPPNADITLAGINLAQTFTATQKINVNSTTAFFVEQDGVKDNVLIVDTTNGRVGVNTAPAVAFHVTEEMHLTSAAGNCVFELRGASASSICLIDFSQGGVDYSSRIMLFNDGIFKIIQNANKALEFHTSNSSRMVIGGGGHVAINTSVNTSYHLLVLGTIRGTTVEATTSVVINDGTITKTLGNYFEWTTGIRLDAVGGRQLMLGNTAVNTSNDYSIVSASKFSAYVSGYTTEALRIETDGRVANKTDDAVTNVITNSLTLKHNTSGTPAANYGTGLNFQGESSTTVDQDMARLAAIWDVATHASRSAALQILISGSGGEVNAAKFDDDATAGNTRCLLYDVDNGQLERVTVGVADSGGIGFKLLRIPN